MALAENGASDDESDGKGSSDGEGGSKGGSKGAEEAGDEAAATKAEARAEVKVKAKAAKAKGCAAGTGGASSRKAFQRLEFLVRDWPEIEHLNEPFMDAYIKKVCARGTGHPGCSWPTNKQSALG